MYLVVVFLVGREKEAVAQELQMDVAVAAQAIAAARGIIHAFRIRCFWHVVHLDVNAGMSTEYFMGPVDTGYWHEWGKQHLLASLGV